MPVGRIYRHLEHNASHAGFADSVEEYRQRGAGIFHRGIHFDVIAPEIEYRVLRRDSARQSTSGKAGSHRSSCDFHHMIADI